jgi:hypothetical protein
MVRNQLVVQFPIADIDDYDALVRIEDTLIQAFEQNRCAVVDGHDIGQARFNIFIYPKDSWKPAIERVQAFLKLKGVLDQAVIVKRLKSSGRTVVIWPENYDGTFEL